MITEPPVSAACRRAFFLSAFRGGMDCKLNSAEEIG
jgi:hypothetical protein